MFRTPKTFKVVNLKNLINVSSVKRSQSTNTGNVGRAGKTILTVVGLGVATTGGLVAFAKYDPSYRKKIEDNVRYSDVAFRFILDGNSYNLKGKLSDGVDKLKDKIPDVGLIQKKFERSKKQTDALPNVPIESDPRNTSPSSVNPTEDSSKILPEKVSEEARKLEEILQAQHSEIEAKNKALDKTFTDAFEKLESKLDDAISSRKQAGRAIRQHTIQLNKALDESEGDMEDVDWTEINAYNVEKRETVKAAKDHVNVASEALVQLEYLIEMAKSERMTAANKNLFNAGDRVTIARSKLSKSEKQFQEALSEEKMATDYKTLLEDARSKLQNQLKGILPEPVLTYIESGDVGKDLTKEEINQFIVYACKQIDNLNKKMAKQQATEYQRVKDAVSRQKSEDKVVAESEMSIELARMNREMNINQQKKIQDMKEEFDQEFRQGLRRQLTVCDEHFQGRLKAQANELQKKFEEKAERRVLDEREHHQSLLSDSLYKLDAIEQKLHSRADMDRASKKAKKLWLSCQTLKRNIVIVGTIDETSVAGTGDSHSKPLKDEVRTVLDAVGDSDPFVKTVVNSIPDEAVERGVYTEEMLRRRFDKVERLCRRVAMIDETGGTLFKYLVSYLQSLFVVSATVPIDELEKDREIDPSVLNTFDVIVRAKLCLQSNRLEQALRYMNLLKGEPRNVARDWIKEMKILLETRQAADALIAHAAAISVKSYH